MRGEVCLCDCLCLCVCEHLYVFIWPGGPPSPWVGFTVGSCLGSLSQLEPAKWMEFPLTIKQGSAVEAKQAEGRGCKGGYFNNELLRQPWS